MKDLHKLIDNLTEVNLHKVKDYAAKLLKDAEDKIENMIKADISRNEWSTSVHATIEVNNNELRKVFEYLRDSMADKTQLNFEWITYNSRDAASLALCTGHSIKFIMRRK